MKTWIRIIAGVVLLSQARADDYQQAYDFVYSQYTDELISKSDEQRTKTEKFVHSICSYLNDIGSGEDFVQWFRWSNSREIKRMPRLLETLGANRSSDICASAIKACFPDGIPEDEVELQDRLYEVEFKDEETMDRLSDLASQQLKAESEVIRALAKWLRKIEDTKQ